MSATNSSFSLSASTSSSFCSASWYCDSSACERAVRSRSPHALERAQDAAESGDHEQADRAGEPRDDVRLERLVAQRLHEQHDGRGQEGRREERDSRESDAQAERPAARLGQLAHRRMERGRRPEDVATAARAESTQSPLAYALDARSRRSRRATSSVTTAATSSRNAGVRHAGRDEESDETRRAGRRPSPGRAPATTCSRRGCRCRARRAPSTTDPLEERERDRDDRGRRRALRFGGGRRPPASATARPGRDHGVAGEVEASRRRSAASGVGREHVPEHEEPRCRPRRAAQGSQSRGR